MAKFLLVLTVACRRCFVCLRAFSSACSGHELCLWKAASATRWNLKIPVRFSNCECSLSFCLSNASHVCATNLKRRINISHPRTYLRARECWKTKRDFARRSNACSLASYTAQLLCKWVMFNELFKTFRLKLWHETKQLSAFIPILAWQSAAV